MIHDRVAIVLVTGPTCLAPTSNAGGYREGIVGVKG